MQQLHAKMPRDGSSDAQPLAVRHENLGDRKQPFLKPMVWLNQPERHSSSKSHGESESLSESQSYESNAKKAEFTEPQIEEAMQKAADKCLAKALISGHTNKRTKTAQPLPTPKDYIMRSKRKSCEYQQDMNSWREPKAPRRHPACHTQHSGQ